LLCNGFSGITFPQVRVAKTGEREERAITFDFDEVKHRNSGVLSIARLSALFLTLNTKKPVSVLC
jgi:hypothetical protein